MAVIRITDSTGATYYDLANGNHLDERKSALGDWDETPPKVQQAWIETWAEEASGDQLSGLESLQEITAFLKENKKRSGLSDTARRHLIVEVLSVPLTEAIEQKHTVGKSTKKFDLIDAVRENLGVPYATLASWAEKANAEVVEEIRKRADAVEAESKRKAALKEVKQSPA